MKRTKNPINVNSEIRNRMAMAQLLGVQYGGKRNLYDVLGYKKDLTWSDYWVQYSRQDIAAAIIDRPVKMTWKGDVVVNESSDADVTRLEQAWLDLENELKIKSKLIRLDKLTGIGQYGVLLLGFSDISSNDKWSTPVKPSESLKLMYIKPFGQESAKIQRFETNPKLPRFGDPLYYNIKVEDKTLSVHYSRVLHVIDNALESDIYGIPRLQVVFNRLMDLEKIIGGSAEMFWRNARPGFSGNIDKEMSMGKAEEDALEKQLDEYEHDLRRVLVNQGVELKALSAQIADPDKAVDVQLEMISTITHIPKRILVGSERGELASSQDQDEWMSFIETRREEYAEPNIVRPLIDLLISYKVLPKATKRGYTIGWKELQAQSIKDTVEIGKIRATAIKEYTSNPSAQDLIPYETFLKYVLGFNDSEVELIVSLRMDELNEILEDERNAEETEENDITIEDGLNEEDE